MSSRDHWLHVEPLENRRMLAVITVDSLLDSTSTNGPVTIREAIGLSEELLEAVFG